MVADLLGLTPASRVRYKAVARNATFSETRPRGVLQAQPTQQPRLLLDHLVDSSPACGRNCLHWYHFLPIPPHIAAPTTTSSFTTLPEKTFGRDGAYRTYAHKKRGTPTGEPKADAKPATCRIEGCIQYSVDRVRSTLP